MTVTNELVRIGKDKDITCFNWLGCFGMLSNLDCAH